MTKWQQQIPNWKVQTAPSINMELSKGGLMIGVRPMNDMNVMNDNIHNRLTIDKLFQNPLSYS